MNRSRSPSPAASPIRPSPSRNRSDSESSSSSCDINSHKLTGKLWKYFYFLIKLIENETDDANVLFLKKLIQDLIEKILTPEEFVSCLAENLNVASDPNPVPFLKVCLPYFVDDLINGRVEFEGIRPPRLQIVFPFGAPIYQFSCNVNRSRSPSPAASPIRPNDLLQDLTVESNTDTQIVPCSPLEYNAISYDASSVWDMYDSNKPMQGEDDPVLSSTISYLPRNEVFKANDSLLSDAENGLPSESLLDDERSNYYHQDFTYDLIVSDYEMISEHGSSPIPEPKRESRREQELNPENASCEYVSIFNSKKTSFITKQVTTNEDKSENVSPTLSETDIHCHKEISPPKRRNSMGNLEASQLPDDDVNNSSCAASTLPPFEFSDNAKRKCSFESTEESSWTSETKVYHNSHERNHNTMWGSVESHGSVVLKIKEPVIRNDNEINKEPHLPQCLKRKIDMIKEGEDKKLCCRKSDN